MLEILDYFFIVFHIVLILFNLFGWIVKQWRKLNLITLLLTGASWFLLGIFYGWGYCFITDWHWQIREAMGYDVASRSYIHFLLNHLFHLSLSEHVVDVATVVLYFAALVVSIIVNIRSGKGSVSF